ncbi:MAG: FAD-dependent monooxygenase [Nitrospirae bacterium]|nr:FAD-dependent monooxygenase [Nitrospirota bacterium]
MEKYDTIIVSAGPAGLRAARVLAEAGKNVLVLEKNRAIGQTICAGGLTAKDMDFVPKNIVDAEFNYMLLPAYAMNRAWSPLLPGFAWFTPASFMLGLAESFIWGVLFGVIFVPIYNYLADKFKKR